ncbi:MAG: hypothetical protein ABI718_16525, partial [Acidobacteriota bacterium]
ATGKVEEILRSTLQDDTLAFLWGVENLSSLRERSDRRISSTRIVPSSRCLQEGRRDPSLDASG